MAARIKEELDSDVELIVGKPGEFTVWVDDRCVAKKTLMGFPDDDACVDGVAEALGR